MMEFSILVIEATCGAYFGTVTIDTIIKGKVQLTTSHVFYGVSYLMCCMFAFVKLFKLQSIGQERNSPVVLV